jgi:hypothetical protein
MAAVSRRRFATPPERGGAGAGGFLADAEAVSGVEEVSVGGWLDATGLREAHPEAMKRTEPTKIIKSTNLQDSTVGLSRWVGGIWELRRWPNCCRGIAAFTGGPWLRALPLRS